MAETGPDERPRHVPILKIALFCEPLDGERVTVVGALELGDETQVLCPTREFLEADMAHCLWLAADDLFRPELIDEIAAKVDPGTHVVVDGTVDCASQGFGGLFGASLQRITLIAEARGSTVYLECGAAGSAARSEDPGGSSTGSARQRRQRHLGSGETALAQGEYEKALELFRLADGMDLFEVPNYEALPGVAEAHCRMGDPVTGKAILADLDCILDVDSGLIPCFVGREAWDAPGHPNPALTPLCFERMCGEIFSSYYEAPSEPQIEKIAELRVALDRLAEICGGEPSGMPSEPTGVDRAD